MRKMILAGALTAIVAAGASGAAGAGSCEPSLMLSGLSSPVGVVERSDGSLVISNIAGDITVIDAEGRRTDIDGVLRQPAPGIVVTPDDRVFVQDDGGSSLFELVDDTTLEPVAEAFSRPVDLAVAPDGSLRVGSWGGGTLDRVCID
ncbi:hypothetical protein [Rhodospira trueperi]|uniref:NHL repeat-containing protein n=1 Tax=Rhodospira trueperi TaxID=69960 RepID=A0A1G7DEX0_9PROT|nr:hypothetical protein [Rhodospira trueperi]SDE49355.1 hypothetical protein SAMN05421720_107130 [Rhodospira trueperi]